MEQSEEGLQERCFWGGRGTMKLTKKEEKRKKWEVLGLNPVSVTSEL